MLLFAIFKYKSSERRILTKMKKCNNCQIEYGEDIMYCEQCGSKLTFSEISSNKEENSGQDVPKKPKSRIGLILLCIFEAVLLVIAIIICIYFANESDYQSREKNSYRYDYSELKEDYDSLKYEYDFYYDNAAIVDRTNDVDDGYYHKRDCEKCKFDRFRIYNINAAEVEGYDPCPECWDD